MEQAELLVSGFDCRGTLPGAVQEHRVNGNVSKDPEEVSKLLQTYEAMTDAKIVWAQKIDSIGPAGIKLKTWSVDRPSVI